MPAPYPIHLAMEWDIEKESSLYKKRKFSPKIVKLLLEYKASPHVRYLFKNSTPLHAAVFHNSAEIVIELLRCGANKEVYDTRRLTPRNLAQNYKYHDLVTILSSNAPLAPIPVIEEEIKLFHVIEVEAPPIVNATQPFSAKHIIDNYLQSTT